MWQLSIARCDSGVICELILASQCNRVVFDNFMILSSFLDKNGLYSRNAKRRKPLSNLNVIGSEHDLPPTTKVITVWQG